MATAGQADPRLINQAQRNALLSNAVEMTQQIASLTVDPTQQNVINIQPRNVGLIKGFLVEVTANILNTAAAQLTRTGFGSANIVKNFQFNDLNNYVRINTPGWHIAMLNSARQGWGFGGSYANNLAMGYGNNWNVNAGPATIAAGANTGQVRHIYFVPLAYSSDDLRGAVYAGVVSATMNLQIALNPTPCVGATDPLNAVYSGNAAATYAAGASVNVTVYQMYWDQIPTMNGGPVLPFMDLNTIYELKTSALNGLAVGQDFPIPYSNFRDFLSTTVVYDNGGSYNAGTDINYFSLTSANFTNLFKFTPEIAALNARQIFMADPPLGVYHFSHRQKPINTLSYGNMELNINASTVNAAAQAVVGFEMFSQVSQLAGPAASSLPAG